MSDRIQGRWAQGTSGNFNGRPRVPEDVKALVKIHSVEAVNRLVQLMRSSDEWVALAAAEKLIDRAFGKVGQSLAIDVTPASPMIEITDSMSPTEAAEAFQLMLTRTK